MAENTSQDLDKKRIFTVCIDPGFVNGALGVVVFLDKDLFYSKGFSLMEHQGKEKKKETYQSDTIRKVRSVLDEVGLYIDEKNTDVIIEAQMGNDEIWLTGVIQALAFEKGWNVKKMRRNMDCCKRLKIPVSKKDISREKKKLLTLKKVREMGYNLKSNHLADAAILFLS